MNHQLDNVGSLKNVFSFRLGTTSYIIPDHVLPNIVFLADKIDDVELVLFESDKISNIPTAQQVNEMKQIAQHNDLSYTVHLPLDTWTGSADHSIRRTSVEKIKRVIDRMAPLAPFAYICHLHGEQRGKQPVSDPDEWASRHAESLMEITQLVTPGDICIETLDYPFTLVENVVRDIGLSICLDIGHLIIGSYHVEQHLDKYLANTRVIHLHGVNQGKDHTDISYLDPALLTMLMQRLNATSAPERVCTLEIFSQKHLERSLAVLGGQQFQ